MLLFICFHIILKIRMKQIPEGLVCNRYIVIVCGTSRHKINKVPMFMKKCSPGPTLIRKVFFLYPNY